MAPQLGYLTREEPTERHTESKIERSLYAFVHDSVSDEQETRKLPEDARTVEVGGASY